MRDDDRIRKHTSVRTFSRVSFWGIPFTQYHILYYSPTADRPPPPQKRKLPDEQFCKGQPGSSFTVSVYIKSTLEFTTIGQYSSTHFAKPFLNRHVASRAVSTSTGISGCFQPGQAKVVLGPTPFVLGLRQINTSPFLQVTFFR